MRPHVVVVGGGLAGLSAALRCADRGARVTLLEERPRLGGATWSTRQHGLAIDNGQHVFLRCCTEYRTFLRRLGVEDRVFLQPALAVPVLAPGGSTAWLRRHRLPRPAHLAPSLLRFSHLPLVDRLRVARTARRLGRLGLDDPALDRVRFGDWLAAQGETPASVDLFWDLLARPTLNLPARDASLALATKVFQTGLLQEPDAADIGFAKGPLDEVHALPAAAALQAAGAVVRLRSPVERIEARGGVPALWVRGERIAADAAILAVPPRAAAALLPPEAGLDHGALEGLGQTAIVNLHVVWSRPVTQHLFAACVRSPLQWIFDRSRAAGLGEGQYLAVSLSAAEPWLGLSRAELRRIFVPAFEEIFPAARSARLVDFFATSEPAATFRQAPGSGPLRPGSRTRAAGLFLAGAWTDTGWPATMEGAVRSGVAAAEAVLDQVSAAGRTPAEAA